MATRTIIILEDDLDGSEAEETVSFALDAVHYELDLNSSHAEELRSVLRPYTEAARKVSPSGPARRNRGVTTGEVRAWAKEQGLAVTTRGRISADSLAQYKAAH